MLRIAVCDNEEDVAQAMRIQIKERLPDCEIQVFESGNALLEQQGLFDIVFLDARMKGLDGIETAKRLRQINDDTKIIFVTAAKERVFEAFDVAAFHYLLKPVDEEKLYKVLDRAVEDIRKKKNPSDVCNGKQLFIKTRYKSSAIDIADIYYLENDGRKIIAHTKLETIEFYAVMTELEHELGNDFFRCHRGYLVNLEYVIKYDTSNIWLNNGEVIYLAKGRYQEFEKQYRIFLKNRKT